MIDNPEPIDWKDLQLCVFRLLSEIGLCAEMEKVIKTPRGEVSIDVWAIDNNSVDKIQYVIECKNWSSAIPQTVVHAFTAVMHETGGNIGFIIAKAGFQRGAKKYLKNTNILGLTYLELQIRYFELWWKAVFRLKLCAHADTLLQYVEPVNSYRSRILQGSSIEQNEAYAALLKRYFKFGMLMAFFEVPTYALRVGIYKPIEPAIFKERILNELGEEFAFGATFYRDLIEEMCDKINEVTQRFNDVFGRNIFS